MAACALCPDLVSPTQLLFQGVVQDLIWFGVVRLLHLHCVTTSLSFLLFVTLPHFKRLACYSIAHGSANPFCQGPDKGSGLGRSCGVCCSHPPSPGHKRALDKIRMNDRMVSQCHIIYEMRQRLPLSTLRALGLSLSGVRLFSGICARHLIKEVPVVRFPVTVFPV